MSHSRGWYLYGLAAVRAYHPVATVLQGVIYTFRTKVEGFTNVLLNALLYVYRTARLNKTKVSHEKFVKDLKQRLGKGEGR